tara:strand:- start:529 stop:1257 length:729 start_codon:yes stop_codon:yes gene_type:complete
MKDKTKIEVSKDYDKFKFVHGNRPVDERHVKKLVNSMKQNYIPTPIIINKKNEIVDGQHRYLACKQLGLDVYFYRNEINLAGLREINQHSKNWTLDDFLDSYVQLERKSDKVGPYTIFQHFKKTTKFPNAVCLMMLTDNRGQYADKFKQGLFTIPAGQYEIAQKQAKMIIESGTYYQGYKRRSYVVALLVLFKDPEFKFKKFIKKLEMNRSKLFHCTNTEDYLDAIEKLYSWGDKNKIRLRR